MASFQRLRALPLVIAHRGGRFWDATDFSYVRESVRDGADIIELDIRRNRGEYVVQHDIFSNAQGQLTKALEHLGGAALYLDVKSTDIDVNHLIDFVRTKVANRIIVGSFSIQVLQRIEDPAVQRNCHCFWPWNAIEKAREARADWVTPICYFVTPRLAKSIQDAGFKFAPSGNHALKRNEIMRNQLRWARSGAYAISTHHVKEMRRLLQADVYLGRQPLVPEDSMARYGDLT